METNSYQDIRKKAERISEEKSVLSYFYSLCEKGDLRYEGKQGKEYFFAHTHQRTGSIAVSDRKNKWYDHSQGVGGDIIYAVRHFERKSFIEAIDALDKSVQTCTPSIAPKTTSKPIPFENIQDLDEIIHPALIKYIHSRGLEPQHFSGIAKEIHWTKGERKFFGI